MDPNNWIALASLLSVSYLFSNLSTRLKAVETGLQRLETLEGEGMTGCVGDPLFTPSPPHRYTLP
jgi:hypothetical protein